VSILLDDREDSALGDQLARFGLPISVVRLDFGDLAIQSSKGLLIGYERKRLTDLISSMQDRRLSGHQLRGMWSMYDRVELIVEGIWRAGQNDEIEVATQGKWVTLFHRGSGISYRQIDSYLYSQYQCGGVPYWRTNSTAETAHLYASRWHWWQKDYELHKSHDVLFTNEPSAQKRGAVVMMQGDPSPVTLVAAQIPSIDAIAWDVGKHFSSVEEMVLASPQAWRRVAWTDRKGRVKHFGRERAQGIVNWLRGVKA
jgi:ERCC4-type nuclease